MTTETEMTGAELVKTEQAEPPLANSWTGVFNKGEDEPIALFASRNDALLWSVCLHIIQTRDVEVRPVCVGRYAQRDEPAASEKSSPAEPLSGVEAERQGAFKVWAVLAATAGLLAGDPYLSPENLRNLANDYASALADDYRRIAAA